jgi:hypothetical protein
MPDPGATSVVASAMARRPRFHRPTTVNAPARLRMHSICRRRGGATLATPGAHANVGRHRLDRPSGGGPLKCADAVPVVASGSTRRHAGIAFTEAFQ